MRLFDRLGRVVRANLNSMVNQAEDPEKILEQTVHDMQDDLVRLRQAVAHAIATQKRTERQQSQSQSMADEWYRRAQLALQKGDEALARDALTRRKSYQDTADTLKAQLDQQFSVVSKLKQNMTTLEGKLSEARTKKDMYIARARAAKTSQQLNEMLGRVGTNSALSAFERMEEKVNQLEAQAEAVAELSAGDPVEQRFRALESGNSVDDDLEMLKRQLASGSTPAGSLPSRSSAPAADPEVEADLAKLRSQLEDT